MRQGVHLIDLDGVFVIGKAKTWKPRGRFGCSNLAFAISYCKEHNTKNTNYYSICCFSKFPFWFKLYQIISWRLILLLVLLLPIRHVPFFVCRSITFSINFLRHGGRLAYPRTRQTRTWSLNLSSSSVADHVSIKNSKVYYDSTSFHISTAFASLRIRLSSSEGKLTWKTMADARLLEPPWNRRLLEIERLVGLLFSFFSFKITTDIVSWNFLVYFSSIL